MGDPNKTGDAFDKLKQILEPFQTMQNSGGKCHLDADTLILSPENLSLKVLRIITCLKCIPFLCIVVMGPMPPPGPGMRMPPPGQGMMGPPPGGILGAAPPGFNPMMGPGPGGPPRFPGM
jgi:hypothetical protein